MDTDEYVDYAPKPSRENIQNLCSKFWFFLPGVEELSVNALKNAINSPHKAPLTRSNVAASIAAHFVFDKNNERDFVRKFTGALTNLGMLK